MKGANVAITTPGIQRILKILLRAYSAIAFSIVIPLRAFFIFGMALMLMPLQSKYLSLLMVFRL
ncbi:MAG: hypothetical protein A2075_15435 [Geobacteraceae bacterium GWC2_58_44]|nr:MAG: hypothetical protein A2075_15435 [Geobacteraceae bacterium GWC2_58_44]HBG07346.1 hypothetical protein [Geobacter sp.]